MVQFQSTRDVGLWWCVLFVRTCGSIAKRVWRGCQVLGSLAAAQAHADTEHFSPPLIYFVNSAMNFAALMLALTLPPLDSEETNHKTLKIQGKEGIAKLRQQDQRLQEHVHRNYKQGSSERALLEDALLTVRSNTRRV